MGTLGLTKVENWIQEAWGGPMEAFIPQEHLNPGEQGWSGGEGIEGGEQPVGLHCGVVVLSQAGPGSRAVGRRSFSSLECRAVPLCFGELPVVLVLMECFSLGIPSLSLLISC